MRNRSAKKFCWLFGLSTPVAGILSVLSPAAKAQVVPTAGRTDTQVSQEGDVFDVLGGTQIETTLFHEFESFGIEENQTANFLSDSGVFNIVGQVSGLSPSYINGLVRVSGSDANLYLVNPAGILFGPSSRLSLSGSFTATTADRVGFGENWLDVLADERDYSSFTESPTAFAFSADAPRAIVNQGDLEVATGESLVLIGGNAISEGRLAAPGGEVGLVSVGGDRTVRLGIPGSLLSLEVESGSALGIDRSFSTTDLPSLIAGGPQASASNLTVDGNGTVWLNNVEVEPDEISVSGEISTRNEAGKGGTVALLGRSVDLLAVTVEASGSAGGTVRIGRGLNDEANLPAADIVLFVDSSQASADGWTGEGGSVVVGAGRTAYIEGTLSADGKTRGGFIETSADYLSLDGLSLSASGETAGGQWLIDPTNIEIVETATGLNQITSSSIEAALDSGVDIAVSTTPGTPGTGDVFLLDSINQKGSSTASLTLTGRRFSTDGSTINLESTGALRFNLNAVNSEAVASGNSIEEAIASIGTVAGDRAIALTDATYTFSDRVIIDTDVDIIGASRENTKLNIDNASRLFSVGAGSDVALRNLQLGATTLGVGGGIANFGDLTLDRVSAVGNRALGSDNGGAVDSLSGSRLMVLNSEFRDNATTQSGGAIAAAGSASSPTIVQIFDSVFEGNRANSGGAISANGTNSAGIAVAISDSRFEQNTAQEGGAIAAISTAAVTVDDSAFLDNAVAGAGGALRVDASEVTLRNSVVDGNTANVGGGLSLNNQAIANIISSQVVNNRANVFGGGIISQTASSTNVSGLDANGRSVFSGNTAGDGGGIYANSSSRIDIFDTDFMMNGALIGGVGSGIYAIDSDVDISEATFSDHLVGRTGGAIASVASFSPSGSVRKNTSISTTTFSNNQASLNGGGIYARGNLMLGLNDVTFSNNVAVAGGGLDLSDGSEAVIRRSRFVENMAENGGAARISDAEARFEDNTLFERNKATVDGGGLVIRRSGGRAIVDNAQFLDNQAGDDGGGVYITLEGSLDVANSLFEGNQAGGTLETSADGGEGGALYASRRGDISVVDTVIADNQANNRGGGISVKETSSLSVVNSEIRENVAGSVVEDETGLGGGLSVAVDSRATVVGSTLLGNEAINGGDGGGIYLLRDSIANLSNSDIRENSAEDDGGGIYASRDTEVVLEATAVRDNLAGDAGGGLQLSVGSKATARSSAGGRTVFADNRAGGDGGGVMVEDADSMLTLEDNTILEGNHSDRNGGGVAVLGEAALESLSTTFVDNSAAGSGGGLYAGASDDPAQDSGTLTIEGGRFADNAAGVDSAGDAILNNSLDANGGGLAVVDGTLADLSVISVLENGAIANGGGLYVDDTAAVEISNATLSDNVAGAAGGAVYQAGDSRLMITDAGVARNSAAAEGGAFAVGGSGELTLSVIGINDNVSGAAGGGVSGADDSRVVVERAGFNGNSATGDGGAINTADRASLDISSSSLLGNTATGEGGAISHHSQSAAEVVSSAVEGNIADGDGGGLSVREASEFTLDRVLVRGNAAGGAGGGVAAANVNSVAVSDSDFDRNTALDEGGGLYLEENVSEVSSSTFTSNSALHGGGVAVQQGDLVLLDSELRGNSSAVDGGGLRLVRATGTVERANFTDNESGRGGGLELSANARASVESSEFVDNEASVQGGGIQVDVNSRLILESSTLAGNEAGRKGGGLYNLGLAELTNATLYENVSRGDGGAILAGDVGAVTTVRNSTISGNQADGVGGGIVSGGAAGVRLSNTIVAENEGAIANDVSGQFMDEGNNLIGQGDGATGFDRSTLVGRAGDSINPLLAPLADNGGAARTQLLKPGSLAINAGINDNLPLLDQRGLSRVSGDAVDIGAVELTEAELLDALPVVPLSSEPSVDEPESEGSVEDRLLDPALTGEFNDWILLSRGEDGDADNRTINRLERAFARRFEEYWDLPLKTSPDFDRVQSVLRRSQEEYKVNSAIIYAIFLPEQDGLSRGQTIVEVEPTPAPDDLLHLALVMPEGELVRYQLQVTREQAARQVGLLRSTISDPEDTVGYRPLTQQLYRWLLAPLEEDLERQGIQNLMYALDTGLRNAPVTAMRDFYGFSLERYGISVVPNMGLTQVDFGPAVKRPTVAMGVSEFELASPLPAVPLELAMVDEVVAATSTTLNEETTIDALESVQALEKPGVLHLATHATFDHYSPESSSISMWNEPLSMKEFAELDWLESDLELLILSACSTALSSANAELGFAGLAAAAGVDASVGSLWEVSDVGTLALMSEFYAQLERTDLRFEALRRAQLALLKGQTRILDGDLLTSQGMVDLPDEWGLPENARLDHPFFWSAFTMVGNPW